MYNTLSINKLLVRSITPCSVEGCEDPSVVMDTLTGIRLCKQHAPRLWIEEAQRNRARLRAEQEATPSPCVFR